MILGGVVELPKTNDIVSTLEEQAIPLTVCWAFMPIRLHRVPFLNTVSNSLITPPDSDRSTSGWFRVLQQLGLGKDKESPLCRCGSGSVASAVDACCRICSFCKCRWAAGGWHGLDKCRFYIQAYEVRVETDHNKIKFQRACLLCLLPCMYKWQKKLQTISLQGFISPHPPFPFLALHSVAAIRRKLSTQIIYYLHRLT